MKELDQDSKLPFEDSIHPHEWYDLGWGVSKYMVSRLKVFKEKTQSYPQGITWEQWQNILQEMIEGFKCKIKEEAKILSREEIAKVDRALDLFRAYFWDLWS